MNISEREIGNPHDTCAVAIKGNIGGNTTGAVTTVGHIPRKISAISLAWPDLFLALGVIACSISAPRFMGDWLR